jgi:hypothetical protein
MLNLTFDFHEPAFTNTSYHILIMPGTLRWHATIGVKEGEIEALQKVHDELNTLSHCINQDQKQDAEQEPALNRERWVTEDDRPLNAERWAVVANALGASMITIHHEPGERCLIAGADAKFEVSVSEAWPPAMPSPQKEVQLTSEAFSSEKQTV